MTVQPDPFLKYAGGKAKLLPEIYKRMPPHRTYVEPFVGGGAVFFGHPYRATTRPRSLISDANPDLIACYVGVRSHLAEVLAVLRELERGYREDFKIHYEHVRRAWNDRQSSLAPAARAALFIYLNKACFNGLWRVNSKGQMNVPVGDRKVNLFDYDNIAAASAALEETSISCCDFSSSLIASTDKDTWVYFDPPYIDTFDSYTVDGFLTADHVRLAETCHVLNGRGVKFLLSTNDHPLMRKLYKPYLIEELKVRRGAGGKGAKRVKVGELLIRNYG